MLMLCHSPQLYIICIITQIMSFASTQDILMQINIKHLHNNIIQMDWVTMDYSDMYSFI